MSHKTPPKSPVSKMPFRFLRGFSKKQRKSLKIAVVGATEVGKSGDYTVKKGYPFPVSSRDVTNQTLPGREKINYSRPRRVWLVTSRLGTGKRLTFFTVYSLELQYTGIMIFYRVSYGVLTKIYCYVLLISE
jgi:hypothetical protein